MTRSTEHEEAKRKLFIEIDSAFPREVDFLRKLIAIPSVNPPGKYDEISRFMQNFALQNELNSEILETPAEKVRSAHITSNEPRLNVRISSKSMRSSPRVLLLAHSDTVPPGDLSSWKFDPFGGEMVNGRMYGRGACDCKGRIAAYIFALLALKNVLKTLPSAVSVAITADEEIGGETGAKYLLDNGKLDCEYCIGEGYTWEVFNGFKGLLWCRISIKGVSAHGATPQLGVSVTGPLEEILRQLREYRIRLTSETSSGTSINVGIIRAGTKINMVPDSATVEVDIRVGQTHTVQQVSSDISTIVKRVEEMNHDLSFNLEIMNQSEPISLPIDHELVRVVQASAEEVIGKPIPVKLWFAHSDTMHFLRKGIPAVNYGAGQAGIAHITNEYVDLEDLRLSTKAVALSVLTLISR